MFGVFTFDHDILYDIYPLHSLTIHGAGIFTYMKINQPFMIGKYTSSSHGCVMGFKAQDLTRQLAVLLYEKNRPKMPAAFVTAIKGAVFFLWLPT